MLVLALGLPAAAPADPWFKVDTHVHSSLSGDATDDIGIISHAARARGYDALMLTDHTAASSDAIGGVVANHVTLDENDFQNWSSRSFGTPMSIVDGEASTPTSNGSTSLHLASTSGAGSYGEAYRWYKRGPNLRSGDVMLTVSIYPTRIDPDSGLYVSLSLGGDSTITSRPPQGYTTNDGVIHPGKHNVLVWQLGNARAPSSDPDARVTTHSLSYTLNQWNTYTINVSQAVRDEIPATDMPIDLNAFTQLKMAAGGQGGTADGYFDQYSLDASAPVPSGQEFVYRNLHVHDYDTPSFTTFPSQEVGWNRHVQRFNYAIADPSEYSIFKQGILSVVPTQQTGYPVQLNHPGLPGGVTQEEAINTFGEGADLMEVAERSDEEGYIKNVMVDVWDGVLSQGVQLLGAWSSDMHRVERFGPATYIEAPSRSFDALMQSLYEGRTYLAANDFPGRAIFNRDGGPDPYAARYPIYVSPSQVLGNVRFKISEGITPGSRVVWTSNGSPVFADNVDGPSYDAVKSVPLGGPFTYIRAELRNSAGVRVAMSQPIFFVDAPVLLPAGMTYNLTRVTTPTGTGYTKLATRGVTSSDWNPNTAHLGMGLNNPSGSLDALSLTTGAQSPVSVTVDGNPVPPAASGAAYDATTGSTWRFDPVKRVLLLKVKQSGDAAAIDIGFVAEADSNAPRRPESLRAHAQGASRIDLSWAASQSTDTAGYTVRRDGVPIAIVPAGTARYSDTALPPGTRFTYRVDAFDASEHHSAESDTASATTDAVSISTFEPVADAYVDSSKPTQQFGAASALRIDGAPVLRTYMRFDVSGLPGTIAKATLRTFDNSKSGGHDVHSADNTWNEGTIDWDNAPVPTDTLYGSSNGGDADAWSSADVTPLVTGEGTVTAEIDTVSTAAVSYSSREGPNPPQLVVESTVPINDPPNAADRSVVALLNGPTPWMPAVNDGDEDPLTCVIVTQPAHGSATVGPDCSAGTYTPAGGYLGGDAFTYQATDPRGATSNVATVTTTMVANRLPLADSTSLSIDEDAGGSWSPSASDPDPGDTVTCAIVSQPAHGQATVSAGCSGGTYTPGGDYNGADSFTYRATDNHGAESVPAGVAVTVRPVNDAPSTADRSVSTPEATPVTWTPSVSDRDGDPLVCAVVVQPGHGTSSVAPDCSSGTYSPAAGYAGPDSFTYVATDPHGASSAEATVGVTVTVPWLFEDGFESGTLAAWSRSERLTVEPALAHSGAFAARGRNPDAAGYAKRELGGSFFDVSYRAYFRVASTPAGGSPTIMGLRTAHNHALASLFLTAGRRLGLRNHVMGTRATSNVRIATGRWYRLEMRAVVNGSASTTEVRVDGAPVGILSPSSVDLGTMAIRAIQIGDARSGAGRDFLYDDVAVRQSPGSSRGTPQLASAVRCGRRSGVSFGGAHRQRLKRPGAVVVRVRSASTCNLTAVGIARAAGGRRIAKSKITRTELPAGRRGSVSLRFTRRGLRRIRRKLSRHPVQVVAYARPRTHSVARRSVVLVP